MLSETLKKLRKQNNKTQNDMAQLLNVKRQTYSAYERGISFPEVEALLKIADYFGVTVDCLLGHNVNPNNVNQQISVDLYSDLSEEELKKVIEYIDFIKSKRK